MTKRESLKYTFELSVILTIYFSAKSVWLLEGLLVYLTEEQVHDLLHFLSIQTNPGSYVIVS